MKEDGIVVKKRRLNLDVEGAVAEFEAVMKEFELKQKLYKILFVAKSLEFEGYRDYTPDDDASNIDWKATKRAQKLLVRKYKQEENLKVFILIDVGENMVFGSTEKLKCEYAAEVTSALSHFIMHSGDNVGIILFGDKVKKILKPARTETHFRVGVDMISDADNYGGGSNLNEVLKFLISSIRGIHALIIISDFINMDKETTKNISLTSQLYETMVIMIRDPLDKTLPEISEEIIIEDPTTNQQLLVNPVIAKKQYEKYALKQVNFVKSTFESYGIDLVELDTSIPFVPELAQFFKGRVKRRMLTV